MSYKTEHRTKKTETMLKRKMAQTPKGLFALHVHPPGTTVGGVHAVTTAAATVMAAHSPQHARVDVAAQTVMMPVGEAPDCSWYCVDHLHHVFVLHDGLFEVLLEGDP